MNATLTSVIDEDGLLEDQYRITKMRWANIEDTEDECLKRVS